MDLLELKKEKSKKLLELLVAKSEKKNREVFQLGSIVASYESTIATEYIILGEIENAVVSLISQASCLCDSRRFEEAYKVYKQAISLTAIDKTKIWINEELNKFPAITLRVNPFQSTNPIIIDNSQLRIPQKEAYIATKNFFNENSGHAIIQLPVGCGKTGTMSLVPFKISNGRVLAIAPNLEIKKTLFENFDYTSSDSFLKRFGVLTNGYGPTCAYLDSEANIHDCDSADIIVTNIQQLTSSGSKKWLSMLAPDFFDMILIDEAHHNVANTWKNAISNFPNSKKISFTATPLRSDGQEIEGERIYRFPISQAIKDGYVKDIASRSLEPLKIFFTYRGEKRKVNLEEILKLRESEWFSRGVALSRECNESIVDASIQSLKELRESGEDHQIIAVACSIDHAKSIRALYNERNITAEVIHSNLSDDIKDSIRDSLKKNKIDVVVQVQMLSEGADYPALSVAAIFRPYRHLMPYVQFVGRIMRVIKQNSPGDKANRGYVISHVGLNVDRWWKELKQFDEDDEQFFNELAQGDHKFLLPDDLEDSTKVKRRKFKQDMNVIEEAIMHFVQDHFMPDDAKLIVDDLIESMNMRGIDFESFGLKREDLEAKLLKSKEEKIRKNLEKISVSPQNARKAARHRLDERIRSAAKQLLNELKLTVVGFDLPRLYPSTQTISNLPAAIVLLNTTVYNYLGVGPKERDLLSEDQLKTAHDNIDEIIDKLAVEIKSRIKTKKNG